MDERVMLVTQPLHIQMCIRRFVLEVVGLSVLGSANEARLRNEFAALDCGVGPGSDTAIAK